MPSGAVAATAVPPGVRARRSPPSLQAGTRMSLRRPPCRRGRSERHRVRRRPL